MGSVEAFYLSMITRLRVANSFYNMGQSYVTEPPIGYASSSFLD